MNPKAIILAAVESFSMFATKAAQLAETIITHEGGSARGKTATTLHIDEAVEPPKPFTLRDLRDTYEPLFVSDRLEASPFNPNRKNQRQYRKQVSQNPHLRNSKKFRGNN